MTVLDFAPPKRSTGNRALAKGLGGALTKYKEKLERAPEMTRNVPPSRQEPPSCDAPLVTKFGIEPDVALRMSASTARMFRVVPVACKGKELTLWADKPLKKRDRDAICDDAHWYRIKFVSEPNSYPQVREHLDEILEYFYPREDPVVIATPGAERGGRSR